jgi:hypothetical protein
VALAGLTALLITPIRWSNRDFSAAVLPAFTNMTISRPPPRSRSQVI